MSDMFSIGLLIIASALFAMSEIGMAAARKIKLRVLADEGDVKAQAVLTLQQKPGAFFAMIQIVLNAIAILGGIVGEQALTPYIKQVVNLLYSGPSIGSSQLCLFFSLFNVTVYLICRSVA